MPTRDLTFAMVGSGGDGVITMGDMLAQAGASVGLHVMKVEAYGPQIRGGESSCTVRVSADPIFAQGDSVQVLVVFNWEDFGQFRNEIVTSADAVVLFEATDETPREEIDLGPGTEDVKLVPVPFIELAKESAGTKLAKNIVTVGLLAEMFDLPKDPIEKAIEGKFTKKGEKVLGANIRGFNAGKEYASKIADEAIGKRLQYAPADPMLLMSGNELSAVAALHAGCRFFAGYPITPSSEILHLLSELMPKVGGYLVQTEDELSAIGAVIGGSFSGVKSMTATSGPGLALMTEMLGLASMAEIPAVIIDVQRGGPSTGLPTKSEQSDLWQALWGSHGDAPRVVLAPADVEDCFHATVAAFNIAEEAQVPVIVLSDQFIAQRRETLSMLTLSHEVVGRQVPSAGDLREYKRYKDTKTGISPMSWPGMKGGEYQTNGLEHNEDGSPTSMFLVHEKMNAKRYRKLRKVREKYSFYRRYGAEKADVGIICWGSSKGPVKEAVLKANGRGERVAAFVPQLLYPFPRHEFQEFLKSVREVVVVELSYSAQFYKYLQTFLDLPEGHTYVFKRSGGKNLTVGEVEDKIRKVLEMSAMRREVLV
ncbi:MAG: 2-oxoacid:acceptor oxidoreductase subunit alpha [Thermoanaerobaculales bacterium]|jgi:2-oxoglutarate ferredoxin oxidoreductase subunit alpha|nr:2-oxoacid:acceptor oxidoreductase subunit alpha [Thermoanaerobaculales bacterium]